MSLLAPALLGFLGLIPVVIIIYLLRSQRRREQVSSVLLWRGILEDIQVKTRFRMPPFTLLLLLQLLVLAIGALGMARPLWKNSTPLNRQTIVVLDASASMAATDVEPSRFEAAKGQARQILGSLPDGAMGAIVRSGAQATLLSLSRDRSELLLALDRASVSDAPGDLLTAWRLAGSIAASRPDIGAEIVLLSDGALPQGGLPPVAATARIFSFGQRADNQAITDVAVRRSLSGSARATAFVRVANASDSPAERRLRVFGDGLQFKEETVQLRPRSTAEFVYEAPAGTRVFSAQLLGRDILVSDDKVQALISGGQGRDTVLVSTNPDLMLRALKAIPELAVRLVKPADYETAGDAELYVFDNFLPAELPGAPVLIVNPPAPSPFASGRLNRPQFAASIDAASALVAGVDFAAVEFGRAAQLTVPQWAAPVVYGPDGPVILEGERENRRLVVFGFEPAATNLPKLVAFPALVVNAVDWLLPSGDGAIQAGDPIRMPAGLNGAIASPDGRRSPANGVAIWPDTERAGQYQLQRLGADSSTVFAVNVAAPGESDVAPVAASALPLPARTPAFGFEALNPTGKQEGFELWPLLAGLALAILAGEWWVYTKRGAH